MRKKNSEKISNSLYYAKDNLQYTITSAPELGILKSLGIVKECPCLQEDDPLDGWTGVS